MVWTLRSYNSAMNSNVTFLTGDCRGGAARAPRRVRSLLRHAPAVLWTQVLHGRTWHDWVREPTFDEHLEHLVAVEGPCSCVLWCGCGSTVRDPVTRQRKFIPE